MISISDNCDVCAAWLTEDLIISGKEQIIYPKKEEKIKEPCGLKVWLFRKLTALKNILKFW